MAWAAVGEVMKMNQMQSSPYMVIAPNPVKKNMLRRIIAVPSVTHFVAA